MKKNAAKKEITLVRTLIPVIGLLLLIVFGVIVMPQMLSSMKEVTDAYGQTKMVKELGTSIPLELIFIFASFISIVNLISIGYKWNEIESSIVTKLKQLIPAMMILFGIGLVVGSWMFSGTIPALIYYGVDLINPNFIYIVAFILPSIFSILTGTSWGSAGTIGVVIMGISGVIGAELPIVAAAIIGGAYFGDKMSPLSDTTNIAALSVNVPLMDHIRSMINTTLPAYILAAIIYTILGFTMSLDGDALQLDSVVVLKSELASLFQFNNILQFIIILLPIIVVLYGSVTKKPIVPTLLVSSITAALIGILLQGFTLSQMFTALNTGFDSQVMFPGLEIESSVVSIVNRGGLYSMSGPVIISIMVFIFVGTLDCIDAIPRLVKRTFAFVKTRPQVIISSLFASGITNALTSNQYATSYIVGETFSKKYDELKVPRKVLSRSMEDFGTMIESMLPWTTTGVYMFAVLGISSMEYWKYQYLSMFGFVIAIVLAITGIGCFYNQHKNTMTTEKGNELNSER